MKISKSNLLLTVVFGSSAWIGTNSVWMQLPLITASLPEGWSLPSYLATVVQIACIAPLIYGIIHKGCPHITFQPATLITIFLSIACVCQLGLAFFWSITVYIGTQQYSLCLYLLLFGLAVVNSISNVLFMPFMAKFHPHYLNAYFVGMGFSSLIPSLLSLIQGSSKYECIESDGRKSPFYLPPRFSVSVFFVIIFLWTCLALISFLMLYKRGTHKHPEEDPKKPDEGTPLKRHISENPENLQAGSLEDVMGEIEEPDSDHIGTKAVWFCLLTTALINAQMNGVIPSVQSYAALPYSQATYHYGIALANVVSPLSSFLSFFITVKSYYIIGFFAVCSSITTAFIVYLASLSPDLIFDSATIGSILSIGAALLAAGLHSYLRVEIASCLRRSHQSESHVFWCGAFIQIGSFIGSAVMFPLVNIAHVFKSVAPCST